jgi:hypothetical protein
VPSQAKALPFESTAMQNDALTHDTLSSCPVVSMPDGWVHDEPFQTEGPPTAAAQNDALTHDTLFAPPQALMAEDQPEPSKV